jgi:cellulose synthase/poly-beta-1,6-N-acetylglucosamine synthase-like glycosyltransferase
MTQERGPVSRVGHLRDRHRLDDRAWRSLRRGLTVAGLLPLTLIVAVKGASLSDDPWLNAYGMGVLLSTIVVMYLAFVRYDDPARSEPPNDLRRRWQPAVTALVAVKDDAVLIEACVRSLLGSTYGDLEVIVVDDASTDGTAAVLDRLAATEAIKVIHLPENVGKKRALVEGVRHARGDVLVFTDSDCVLAPDAIERCVDALRSDPQLGGVSGHARASNSDESLLAAIQDVWYDGQFGVAKAAEASYGSVTCVSGPLAAFRREAIVNYFPAWAADTFLGREFRFATDRQLTGYVLGQPSISDRLRSAHADDPLVRDEPHEPRRWRVAYCRSARAWTHVPPKFTSVIRQQVRWKKSFVRNLFFTGRFIWRRGLMPTLLYYGHVLWVVLGPFMAIRHLILLPLQGAWEISLLYGAGVIVKGLVWGVAYRVQNPGDRRWVLRPAMNVLSALVLSWLLPYSIATLRRGTWSRVTATAGEDEDVLDLTDAATATAAARTSNELADAAS